MLPGQTKKLDYKAAETEAIVTFYSSLHKQRPDSEMAQRFMVQHGLLPADEALAICERLGINNKVGNKTEKKRSKQKAEGSASMGGKREKKQREKGGKRNRERSAA